MIESIHLGILINNKQLKDVNITKNSIIDMMLLVIFN